ncbi:MAG: cell division protein FtsQ/DivIB [bacterium]|jgi:cell division protein FtsQ
MAHRQTAQLELERPERRRQPARLPVRERAPEPGVWRRRVRIAMIWLGAAVSATAVAAGVYLIDDFLATDSRFVLRSGIAVEGIKHAPRERIDAVFARDMGRSIYLVPLAERRASLLAIDWVKDATVSRRWPDQIAVRLVERTPVAFLVAPGGGAPALIDADGVILSLPPRAKLDLPALTGITREQTLEARRERVSRAMEFLRDAGAWAGRVSEVDATDSGNLKVTITDRGRAYQLWMGNRNYAARLENFLKFREEINRRLPFATIFDLRLDDRITVPAEGNQAPPAAVAKSSSGGRRAR